MIRLKLTVDVPDSVDTYTLNDLLISAGHGTGITITTARGVHLDVDLLDVERVSAPSLIQEVTS